LTIALNHLLDGVRRLPYSDEQISHSIAEAIALWYYSDGGRGYSENGRESAAEQCFHGEVMDLEFGAADGSYSRACASAEMLTHAIRSDIGSFLEPSHREALLSYPPRLVQVIRKPQLLFDFSRLADFFVRQLVPFQIVFRRQLAVFFSPARLDRFGRP
jgi:hypothetical protein